ncbi:hypothetical protein [Falsirhodobacter sp. 1013]|uniref:hypothetical protein n=1 Tax=Falsirhodobacter sp. 1013 TaxID=3417566 RepID=UPI003EBAAFA5
MTLREAIFLRHHGLKVCKQTLRSTDFNEWMRVVICLARRDEPQLFDASGRIRNHDTFTRWLAEAYPPKEAV